MEADTIIIGLDVLENHVAGFAACGGKVAGKALGLEGAPERFHHGVVVAVGPATHAGDGADFFEQLAVSSAGVLAAAITVDDEAGLGTVPRFGLVQPLADQGGFQGFAHGPTDESPRGHI